MIAAGGGRGGIGILTAGGGGGGNEGIRVGENLKGPNAENLKGLNEQGPMTESMSLIVQGNCGVIVVEQEKGEEPELEAFDDT